MTMPSYILWYTRKLGKSDSVDIDVGTSGVNRCYIVLCWIEEIIF
jgi:hypothetical protein